MERLNELGLMDAFGSNMPMEAPFEVDFIEDFKTLKKRCQMLNPTKRKKIERYFYFGSEMGKWLPKDQSWKNVDFIEELQTIRKDGLSFCGDAIDRVDERALNETHFDGQFTKFNAKNPTVAYYDDWQTGERTFLQNIPKTKIKFDTWYSANFYMEPQTPDTFRVPLNQEHEIVKKYLDCGQKMKDTGYHRQEVKRAIGKVLELHFSTCLRELSEDKEVLEPTKAEIA